MNKNKKIYIGCALASLPPEKKKPFLSMVDEIKFKLKEHFEVLEFLGINDGGKFSPLEVYSRDIKECVMGADCMLAICDYTSSGLGYEMGTAIEKRGIPVLAVGHKDIDVSRLIRGIDHKNFKFYSYDTVGDIIDQTIKVLK